MSSSRKRPSVSLPTDPKNAKGRRQESQPGSLENTCEDDFLATKTADLTKFEDVDCSDMLSYVLEPSNPTAVIAVNESFKTQEWGNGGEESTEAAGTKMENEALKNSFDDLVTEDADILTNTANAEGSSENDENPIDSEWVIAPLSENDEHKPDGNPMLFSIDDEKKMVDDTEKEIEKREKSLLDSGIESEQPEENGYEGDESDQNAIRNAGSDETNDSEAVPDDANDLEESKQKTLDKFCKGEGNLVELDYRKEGNKNYIVAKYEVVLEPEATSSKMTMEEDLTAEMHCTPSTSSAKINTTDNNEESLESLKDSIRLQGMGIENKNNEMEDGTAKMKYGSTQTFEFSNKQPKYVVAFMVHKMAKYAKIPINAEDAKIVCGAKNAPTIPATGKCPFIVKNTEVYYRTFHDKTYGAVHGAVVRVEDVLRIVPDMVSSHEKNLNINIGNKEACRLHLKFVIAPITDEVFDQVVIEDQDNIFLSCNSVLKSFEQNVEFIKELGRDPKKKKVDRSQEINFPTESYMWPLEETQLPEHQAAIKAFKKEIHMTLKLKSVQEGKTFMANVRSLMQ